jgi:GTPase
MPKNPSYLPPEPDDDSAEPQTLAHSGFVVVIGKPNVGKSTLMNQILGEKIAIVSPKPQTTRLRQLGIYSEGEIQAVFIDTPGIHRPFHQLGEFMVGVAIEALRDADVILFVVDLSRRPDEEDLRVADLIRQAHAQAPKPIILALNKLDHASAAAVLPNSEAYQALVPATAWTALSALNNAGVTELLAQIVSHLPPGINYYPTDTLSDLPLRQMAAEIIREKALLNLDQEVPHALAVDIQEYVERSAKLTYVSAYLYVERDTQKAILIGKNGAMLKAISSTARTDIEQLTGTKVFLELWVKVLKNWRSDKALLQRMGYRLR